MDGVHIGKHDKKAMSAEASLGSRDKFIRRTITQVPWKVPEAINCHDYQARVVVEVRVRKKTGGVEVINLWVSERFFGIHGGCPKFTGISARAPREVTPVLGAPLTATSTPTAVDRYPTEVLKAWRRH